MPLMYLVRHGETDWNREKRWQGQYDRALSAAGRAQASAAGRRLRAERITQIHTSDLKRALETARVIGELCELRPRADPALREIDVGNWAGLTHVEAKQRFPEGYARRRAGGTGWEGGESYEQMGERVRAYVTRLAGSARGSERIALVCHSGVIRMLVVHALGLGPKERGRIGGTRHGALTVLRFRKGEWSLRMYNDTCHLHAEDESARSDEGAGLTVAGSEGARRG
jgi:broad specificity phosphatase PhoE